MDYSKTELDMARKGYVYFAKCAPGQRIRKVVRNIAGIDRAELVFDTAAYECHSEMARNA